MNKLFRFCTDEEIKEQCIDFLKYYGYIESDEEIDSDEEPIFYGVKPIHSYISGFRASFYCTSHYEYGKAIRFQFKDNEIGFGKTNGYINKKHTFFIPKDVNDEFKIKIFTEKIKEAFTLLFENLKDSRDFERMRIDLFN